MAMDLWRDPFREMFTMRDLMDRILMDPYQTRSGSGWQNLGFASFPIDVAETDNGYVVHAALPGVKPENVQIEAKGDTLTIRGNSGQSTNQQQPNQQGQSNQQNQQGQSNQQAQQNQQGQSQNQRYLMRERRNESFYRTITLPEEIDASKASATFENGVLTIELPRAEKAQSKRIPITNASTSQGQIQPGSNSKTSREFGLGIGNQPSAEADQSAMGTDSSDQMAQPNG